jgi:hypothetical protein
MRMFKKITFVLAAIAPLAMSACTTAGTSGTVGASEPSGYTTVPTASDAQRSRSSVAPGNYGDTFVDSPEPGFNPDTIQEAP